MNEKVKWDVILAVAEERAAAAERERWIRLAVETYADPPCECEHEASAHEELGNGDLGQCQAVCECEGYVPGDFEVALRRAGGAPKRSES